MSTGHVIASKATMNPTDMIIQNKLAALKQSN
jgi:hypothetical protein